MCWFIAGVPINRANVDSEQISRAGGLTVQKTTLYAMRRTVSRIPLGFKHCLRLTTLGLEDVYDEEMSGVVRCSMVQGQARNMPGSGYKFCWVMTKRNTVLPFALSLRNKPKVTPA